MEQNEYRKSLRGRATRRWGYGAGLTLAGYTQLHDAAAILPEPGGLVVTGSAAAMLVGAGAHGYLYWHRSARRLYQRRLRAAGWANAADLSNHIGAAAARRKGRTVTRPDLNNGGAARLDPRNRQPLTAYGAVLGRTITGDRRTRGRTVVADWEQSILVYGPTGSYKSTFLAGAVADAPGASLVISTKEEFAAQTARLRQLQRGPVRIWDLRGSSSRDELRDGLKGDTRLVWDPVRNCSDPTEARMIAQAIASTVEAGTSGDMFREKAGTVLAAVLVAAARDGGSLSTAAGWLNSERWSVPIEILQEQPDNLSGLIDALQQMASSEAKKTSGSVAQTATAALGFLTEPQLAAQLAAAEGEASDIAELIRQRATIYVITDNNGDTRPLVAALFAHVQRAAARVAAETVTGRLAPPLAVVADEIHLTLRGVPVDTWAATVRSTGVWMALATQDRAQLVTGWGEDRAETIESNLPITVCCGVPPQQTERYSDQVGMRTEQHVSGTKSKPASLKPSTWLASKLSREGHTTSENISDEKVRIMPPEDFNQLSGCRALVIPSTGRACIVRHPFHWRRIKKLTEKAVEKAGTAGEQQREQAEPPRQWAVDSDGQATAATRPEAQARHEETITDREGVA